MAEDGYNRLPEFDGRHERWDGLRRLTPERGSTLTRESTGMTRQRYSAFHRFAQRMASTSAGAWFLSRAMHPLDRLTLKLSGGRFSAAEVVAGLPIVMIEMTGARSQLPRSVPLIYVQIEAEPEKLALVATNWGQRRHPAWYFNLKAHPNVTCTLKGRRRAYKAHVASVDEYQWYWPAAVETYPGYDLYRRRISGREIPILILEPLP